MRTWVLLVGLCLSFTAGGQDLQPRIVELIELYNTHQAVALPLPDNDALTELVDGGIVMVSERIKNSAAEDDRIRVVGYRLYERPRTTVWVSALFKQLDPDAHIIEHLTPGEAGGYRLYQYLPLPWPIKDRHWAITVDKAITLAQATADQIWEHRWDLTPDGESSAYNLVAQGLIPRLDKDRFRKAVYLPRNQGGWTAFRVTDDVTLLSSHVSTVLSGWIPDSFVAAYTRRRVDSMMGQIEESAANVHEFYNPKQFAVFTGSGEPIDLEQLQRDAN